jgi:hypothetical protein
VPDRHSIFEPQMNFVVLHGMGRVAAHRKSHKLTGRITLSYREEPIKKRSLHCSFFGNHLSVCVGTPEHQYMSKLILDSLNYRAELKFVDVPHGKLMRIIPNGNYYCFTRVRLYCRRGAVTVKEHCPVSGSWQSQRSVRLGSVCHSENKPVRKRR